MLLPYLIYKKPFLRSPDLFHLEFEDGDFLAKVVSFLDKRAPKILILLRFLETEQMHCNGWLLKFLLDAIKGKLYLIPLVELWK